MLSSTGASLTTHACLPLTWGLYLPQTWIDDPVRRAAAWVPDAITYQTKGELALAALDRVRAWGVGARVVGARRCGLWHQSRLPLGADGARPAVLRAGRREYHGVAGCPRPAGTASVSWPRRPRRHLPQAAVPGPSALDDIATTVPPTAWHTVTWRQGTKGPMRSRFAHTTVWPAHRWTSGGPPPSAPVRLLIE